MTDPVDKREPSAAEEFQQAGQENSLNLVQEFLLFVRTNKKWWLIPILLVFGLVGLLVMFGSTGAAPFVYTLF